MTSVGAHCYDCSKRNKPYITDSHRHALKSGAQQALHEVGMNENSIFSWLDVIEMKMPWANSTLFVGSSYAGIFTIT